MEDHTNAGSEPALAGITDAAGRKEILEPFHPKETPSESAVNEWFLETQEQMPGGTRS